MNITGYYGCACHPFASWEECKREHTKKIPIGTHVTQRHNGKSGIVDSDEGGGFFIVKYGPLPRDLHLEHAASLILKTKHNPKKRNHYGNL